MIGNTTGHGQITNHAGKTGMREEWISTWVLRAKQIRRFGFRYRKGVIQ